MRRGSHFIPIIAVLVLLTGTFFGGGVALAQPITVDGDLSDWTNPDGSTTDVCNDVIQLCKSGFDFTELFAHYDPVEDILYLAINIMDDGDQGGQCMQDPGNNNDPHGVPGDADGDNDPSSDSGRCLPQQGKEQPCIGFDEFYRFLIDTDLDLSFSGPNDLRIEYRNNQLMVLTGQGEVINGITTQAAIGMGAASINRNCPNQTDNFDIEFAIHDYSALDDIPVCYGVNFFSGSQVDGPPEDVPNEPFFVDNLADPMADIIKSVRNITTDGEMGKFNDKGVVARPNDVVEFKVEIFNTGNLPLTMLEIRDQLPPEYINITGLSTECSLGANNLITCSIAGLPVGGMAEVRYRATVDPGVSNQVIRNVAFLNGDSIGEGSCIGGPIPEVSDPARVVVFEILCEKTVSVDGGQTFQNMAQAVPGQTLIFKVRVTNDSKIDLDSVSMVDVLPAAYDQVMVISGECMANGNEIMCSVDTLPQQSFVEFLYSARLRPEVDPSQDVVNTAVITAFFGEVVVGTDCSAIVDVLESSIDCIKEISLDGINFFPSINVVNCQEVFFRVMVTNDGEADLFDVTITDPLPAQYSSPSIVMGAGCQVQGGGIVCTLPAPLPSGMSTTVVYRAIFDGVADGQVVTNTATVTGTPGNGPDPEQQGEPVMTSCSADATTQVADIVCQKMVSLTNGNFVNRIEAVPGQEVFFRVQLQNTGSAPFFSTVVFDELPNDCFANVQIVSGAGCTVNGTTVECDLGALAPQGTRTIIYKADVVGLDRLCVNEARVTGTPGTADNPGCAAISTCDAMVDILNVDIICDKNVSLDGITFGNAVAAQPGDTVFFEVLIDIPAGGEACFLNVQLEDMLAPQLTNIMIVEGASCMVQGQSILCSDIGPVPFCPGDDPLRVVYKADLAMGPLPETILNTARITAIPGIPGVEQGGDSATTECSATVRVLDLDIECVKTSTPSVVVPGQSVLFEVTITNTSMSDEAFEQVSLVDTLSPGFSNIVVMEPAGLCEVNQAQRMIECDDLGPLAQGESVVVRYTAVVTSNPPVDPLFNDAVVTGIFGEITKTSACNVSIPLLDPCIECVKEGTLNPNNTGYGNPIAAIPGQRVYFRVTITNCGDAPFFKVALEDMLPAGFVNPQIEEGACKIVGNTILCDDLGPLDVGQSTIVRFSAEVAEGQQPGEIVNIAEITGFPGTKQNPGETVMTNCPLPVDVLEIDFTCTKLVSLDGVNYFETIEAVPGQEVFFRVVVDNTGEVPLVMTVTDDIGSVYINTVTENPGICSFTGSVLTCTFDLGVGQSRTLDYRATLRDSATEGTYVNTVDLSVETGPAENPGAEQTKTNECSANVVVLEPEIICEKGISIDGINYFPNIVVLPEDHVFYRVIIRNDGPVDLRDIRLTDTVPEECFINVTITSPAGMCNANGNDIECEFLTLAAGDSIEVFYEADVKLEPADQCPNTVSITAESGTEENPGARIETECTAFASTIIIRIPTLSEIGFLILCAAFGVAMILYRRR